MLINGGGINTRAINGPGAISERVKEIVKASSDIPLSAREEFNEYIDTLEDSALESTSSMIEWLLKVSKSDAPYNVLEYLDQIINSIRGLLIS